MSIEALAPNITPAGLMNQKFAPWIVELLRKTPDANTRARYNGVLVALQASGVRALLRTDLTDSADPGMRSRAAEMLLALEDEEGMRIIGDRLRAGDASLLGSIFLRATRLDEGALPDGLVPAMLDTLRSFPGEIGRLQALYTLRARGKLDDATRTGLVLAYRTEPSRRVARQIGTVLTELAHR